MFPSTLDDVIVALKEICVELHAMNKTLNNIHEQEDTKEE